MHIAMFTDYYLPTLGGVQTSIKAQKEALEKAGHRVTIFCPLHEPSTDLTIIRLPSSKYFKPDNFPFAWPLNKVVTVAQIELEKLGDVDIIHTHSEMGVMFAGLIAGRNLGIPIVQTMHGRHDVYAKKVLPLPTLTSMILARIQNKYISHIDSPSTITDAPYTRTSLDQRMWRIMTRQANSVDHVIVPSHHFAKKLHTQGVIKPLTVLSNSIETSAITTHRPSKSMNYEGGRLRIMWCGRFSPEKRPLEFLEAISLVGNSVTVNMYGDGIEMKSISRFVKRHRLENIVTLHGSVPQSTVLRAMRTHHVFISSSYDFDNQPMVLLEAVATGLPVVYCDPDLAEVVPKGGSLMTKSPSAVDIAVAISYLQANFHIVNRMSRSMLAVHTNDTQSTTVHKLIHVYEMVIQRSLSLQSSK